MDEPDDDYEKERSTFDSFLARKELLLGYTELTVEDVNNVFDFKVRSEMFKGLVSALNLIIILCLIFLTTWIDNVFDYRSIH